MHPDDIKVGHCYVFKTGLPRRVKEIRDDPTARKVLWTHVLRTGGEGRMYRKVNLSTFADGAIEELPEESR